jgi:ribosomal protein S18 acetylase RimI-like enzyme
MVSISSFSIDDYEEVISLWRATPGIGLSDADSREAIAAYLAHNPGLSFVARDGQRVVGAVLCGSDGRRGYLHHLAVHPDARRQGTGEALVERCLSGLREVGIHKCHLFVIAGNAEGQAFWQHVGWKLRTDLVIMSKDIAKL